MNKLEAQKAVLEGKKIGCSKWSSSDWVKLNDGDCAIRYRAHQLIDEGGRGHIWNEIWSYDYMNDATFYIQN